MLWALTVALLELSTKAQRRGKLCIEVVDTIPVPACTLFADVVSPSASVFAVQCLDQDVIHTNFGVGPNLTQCLLNLLLVELFEKIADDDVVMQRLVSVVGVDAAFQ